MTQSINNNNKDDASLAVSHMSGNLPTEVKQAIETVLHKVMARSPVFGSSISKHLVVTEASIVPKAEEASRTEARVVCEVTVGEGAASLLSFTSPLGLMYVSKPPPATLTGPHPQICLTPEEAYTAPALPF